MTLPNAREVIVKVTGSVFTRQEIDAWEPMLTKAMIEFAKLHVEAALKRAYQNQGMSWTNSRDEEVKLDLFMRNSYPLTNIK
jgi:hypothetical protein